MLIAIAILYICACVYIALLYLSTLYVIKIIVLGEIKCIYIY